MNFMEEAFVRLLKEKFELIFDVEKFDLTHNKDEESITLDFLIDKNKSELIEEIMTFLVKKYDKLLYAKMISNNKTHITGSTTKFNETIVSGKFTISKELLTDFLDMLNTCSIHSSKKQQEIRYLETDITELKNKLEEANYEIENLKEEITNVQTKGIETNLKCINLKSINKNLSETIKLKDKLIDFLKEENC